jgi:hypothetical protein
VRYLAVAALFIAAVVLDDAPLAAVGFLMWAFGGDDE